MMKRLVLLTLCIFLPSLASAACHTVTVTGSGTHSGADWNNAMVGLPATPVRGDSYFLADGTGYNVPTSWPAVSGTTLVSILKAVPTSVTGSAATAHCTDTGWSDATYGSGQAIWTGSPAFSMNQSTPAQYVVFSGQTRTSLNTGYGFKLDSSSCSNTQCYTLMLGYNGGTKANNITVEYVEFQQSNPSGSTNFDQDYGVYDYCNDQTSHASGCHDLTFLYNYHHNSACDFMFTRNVQNWTVKYSYFYENNGGAACHGQNWEDNNSVNVTFAYNVFDESRGTAVLVVLSDGFSLTTDGFYVYGNVFYDHSGGSGWTANGTVACINPGITCNNMEVYNNTFAGQQNTGAGAGANSVGDYVGDSAVCTGTCIFENNLFYNVTTSGAGAVTLVTSLATEDYNTVIFSGATSPFTAAHDITTNTNLNHFTNLTATPPAPYDFTLATNGTTDYGTWNSLSSPYNSSCATILCASFVSRTANRGAYEYATSTPTGPIAEDSSSASANCGNVSSCTWTQTIGANATDIYVGLAINNGYNGPNVSSVTVGGIAATLVKSQAESGYIYKTWLYHLFSPPTGLQSIVVTLSTTVGTTNGFFGGAIAFTGSSTSAVDGTPVSVDQSTLSTSVSANITTVNPNAWTVDMVVSNPNNATLVLTPAAPQIMPVSTGNLSGINIAMSYRGPVATPAATSDGYSYSAATRFALIVASLKAAPAPAASLSPSSLTFASTAVGASTSPQNITLSNPGDATLSISSIGLAGTNPGDFSQTNTCGLTLASLGSCTISVTFSPVSSNSRSATVSIVDDAAGSPHTAALSGTAYDTHNPLQSAYIPAMDTNCTHSQYNANVWMSDWRTKLLQGSGTNPGSACTLTIYGTQNEFVDFQVHYHDSGAGTTGLNIVVGDFAQTSPNAETISCSTPLGQCINYREAYVPVNTYVTATSSTYYDTTGSYPDILIPKVDPYWGQTTNAYPFTVSASKNQSAWVDVHIPSGVPAGYYLGSVTVQTGCPSSCTTISTNPITIAVWQWPSASTMPSTSSLRFEETGIGYNVGCVQMYDPIGKTVNCGSYPDAASSNDTANTMIWLDADLLLKDHRWSNGGQDNIYPQTGSFATYNSLVGPIMNGTGTHSNTVLPLLTGSINTTKQLAWLTATSSAIWSNWQTNFVAQGWGAAGQPPLYDYLVDEPHGSAAFSAACSNATTRHAYLSPAVPELVTTDYVTAAGFSALNCIDWMIVPQVILEPQGGPIQSLANYQSWVTGSNPSGASRVFGSYQTCSNSGTCTNGTVGSGLTFPNYNIDGLPAANRAMEWLTFMHGQTMELYYNVDECSNYAFYTSCDPSGTYVNSWVSQYSQGGWGEGNLIYYGSVESGSVNYMGSGVTTPLILPSIRLKLSRDGLQDYEYLYKLNALGYTGYVSGQVSSWVTNSYTFETTGSGLNSARNTLGTFMHALSWPGSTTPSAPPSVGILLSALEKGKGE